MTAAQLAQGLSCGRARCECSATARRGTGNTHCPSHDDRTPSLTLRDGDAGVALWHCQAGCTNEEVRRALVEHGLWHASQNGRPRAVRRTEQTPRERKDTCAAEAQAQRILDETTEDTGRVSAYVQSRGLSGRVPAQLRFHRNLYFADGEHYPAMVARVEGSGGVAVHRTFLASDGDGRASAGPAKKCLGPTKGGAVRLADLGDATTIAYAEGIETSLAVLEATRTVTWAALSAMNLPDQEPPSQVRVVEIWADHDLAGLKYAAEAGARHAAAGRVVYILTPPRLDEDWLDVFVRDGAEALRQARATSQPWVPPTAGGEAGMGIATVEQVGDAEDPSHDNEGGTLGVPPFPDEAWRGVFADYRQAMTGATEASDVGHFAALWTAAAAVLRRRLWMHMGLSLYPNPFLLHIGATGDGKTTAQRYGLNLLPDEGVKVHRGGGSGEGIADWMQQPEGMPPIAHLLAIEEFGALMAQASYDGGTLVHFLTQTFDCPPVYETKYRKNPIRIVEPTPLLYAGSTPDWFWKNMPEAAFHGGFGNRLFVMAGAPKAPIPIPCRPVADLLLRVRTTLGGLGSFKATEVQFSPEAAECWDDFYRTWKRRSLTLDPLTQAATKRIPGYALKLGMVYAALEQAIPILTVAQLDAAIRVALFGEKSFLWLAESRREQTRQGRCEEAIRAVLKHADLPTWQIHQRISGRFDAEQVNRAVRAMGPEGSGSLIVVGCTTRGKSVYGLRGRQR